MERVFISLHGVTARLLDPVYRISTFLAVFSLLVLLFVVVLQIIARFASVPVVWASDIAGYSLVATTFLAMAPTLRAGIHIRVNLILQNVRPRARFVLDIWSFSVGLAFACYGAWWCIIQVVESLRFGDLSTGLVAFPLWIPQSFMAIGFTTFALSMLEGFLGVLAGRGTMDSTLASDQNTDPGSPTDQRLASPAPGHGG